MSNLHTTTIMKTDIVSSSAKVTGVSNAEMVTLLNQHKRFISEVVERNGGSILKGEGDAFWITFHSVTTAALTAIEIHQNLHVLQVGQGEQKRLSIRIVVTVGDVVHHENDIYGNTMVLTARLESITPADEIYLSQAAWLILNKAEVSASFVDEFVFKGMKKPERVYHIDQKSRTRVITDQIILYTDLHYWTTYIRTKSLIQVEEFLIVYDDLINKICEDYGGVIRNFSGDSYFLTFFDLVKALQAVEECQQQWTILHQKYKLNMTLSLHRGDVHILRSYVYGNDINTTAILTRIANIVYPDEPCTVVVSQRIKEQLPNIDDSWHCHELDRSKVSSEFFNTILDECGAYQMKFESG